MSCHCCTGEVFDTDTGGGYGGGGDGGGSGFYSGSTFNYGRVLQSQPSDC